MPSRGRRSLINRMPNSVRCYAGIYPYVRAYLGDGVRRGSPEVGEEFVDLAGSAGALQPEGVLSAGQSDRELPPFARGSVSPVLLFPHGFADRFKTAPYIVIFAHRRSGPAALN